MKQIGIDQVKQLGSQLENLNSAIDANDNSIIELNTAVEETNNSIIELNNILEEKQDTLIAGEGIIIEDNVISISGSSKSALQVTCSYNNDVLKGVAVVVDETTITTKSNGLATFTGLDSGVKMVTANKDGYRTTPPIPAILENPFEVMSLTLQPVTLTFTVKDVENNVIVGATITVGNYTATTNDNGQAVISGILDGTYTYIITKATFTNATGTISINRQNVNQPVIMTSALIVGKSSGSYSVGDTVKLNAGTGDNNYDFTAYPSDTAQTNDLTIEGEVAEVKTDTLVLTSEPTLDNADISVVADQDNADIQFNNSNDICTVNIVADMKETHNYLAFKRTDNAIIYFKDRTYPFVPSDNNTNETSFTYYTFSNGVMTEHTATTQSSSSGNSTYDGTTLTIHSATVAVDGVWTRDTADDEVIATEYNGAIITTSGYLTTPQPIIPTTNYWRFAIEKSNDWDLMLVVGGAFTNLANLQEIVVPNNTIVDIYATKKNETPAIFKSTYTNRLTITNDRIYRKVNFVLQVTNEGGANTTLTVNGISFTGSGSQLKLDVYAGQTVSYKVEKEGFTTQTGTYTIPDYPTIKEKIQSITLVSA